MKMSLRLLFVVLGVIFVVTGSALAAAKKPTTVAELALYRGTDRQQILEEGAKKEGNLVFYTTGTQAKYIIAGFTKKYPYIKVEEWRAGGRDFVPRILEEYQAGRHSVSVLGTSDTSQIMLEEAGLLQPFYSPELASIEEDAIRKAPSGGVFSGGHFSSGRGLGWNTKMLTKAEVPKTYQDLLNPKWKGKMAIISEGTGVLWMGVILKIYGDEFVKKLAQQDFTVHMVSGRALNDMIVAGEYALSPTITDSHVEKSKQSGAPVDWLPLEPVACNIGQIALPKYSAQPHAAMLYIDYDLSQKAGEIYKAEGYNSPRKDVVNLRNYKKAYVFSSTKQANYLISYFDKLFLKR